MTFRQFTMTVLLLLAMSWTQFLSAEQQAEKKQADNPLATFERLIGGQWHTEGSYQEFEWGLGKQSVKSRSYFMIDGEPRLVSEGLWYWHPEKQQIKGVFTAIDMPVVFFDYTTWFEEGRMVSDLLSFDANGVKSPYRETWDFTDDTHYDWKLMSKGPEDFREVMGASYSRRE